MCHDHELGCLHWLAHGARHGHFPSESTLIGHRFLSLSKFTSKPEFRNWLYFPLDMGSPRCVLQRVLNTPSGDIFGTLRYVKIVSVRVRGERSFFFFVTHPKLVKNKCEMYLKEKKLDDGGSERPAGASQAYEPPALPRVARVSPIASLTKVLHGGSPRFPILASPQRGGGLTRLFHGFLKWHSQTENSIGLSQLTPTTGNGICRIEKEWIKSFSKLAYSQKIFFLRLN